MGRLKNSENQSAGILNFSSKIENWVEEILEAKMKITEDNPEMVHYWTYFPYDISVRAPRADGGRAVDVGLTSGQSVDPE